MQFRDARTHSAAGVQSGLTGKGERRCAHRGCMNAHTLKMEPAVSSEALITIYQSTQRLFGQAGSSLSGRRNGAAVQIGKMCLSHSVYLLFCSLGSVFGQLPFGL